MSPVMWAIIAAGAVLVVAIFVLWCCWRRWSDRQSYQLAPWGDSNRTRSTPLVQQDSMMVTPPDPELVAFNTYHNSLHNFQLLTPENWTCKESSSAHDSLIAHFSCPETEPSFKRLSVAWDDLCWTEIDAHEFAEHVIRHLPTAVQGSRVISNRPVRIGSRNMPAHEIVYVITDEDGTLIKLLNVALVANRKAFTLTFSIAEPEYATYLALAYRMINSFAPRELSVAPSLSDTPTDPDRAQWAEVASENLHVRVRVPANWPQDRVGNSNVLRFTCPRTERTFKSINFFIIDLTCIESESLIDDLVQFYKEEVEKQGSVRVVNEVRIPAEDGSVSFKFTSEGKRGLIDITSSALVGLHGERNSWGHIVTFTSSSSVFARYEQVANHIFTSVNFLSGGRINIG